MTEQYIDVSDLEPPEPMEVILDAVADLPAGDHLRVRHRRNPTPLFRMLREMRYGWHMRNPAPGHFEILIWPEDMPPPPGVEAQTPGKRG